jgi:hypothetical protein
MMKRYAIAALSLAMLAACEDNGMSPEERLAAIRQANEQYQSVDAAVAAGFVSDNMCVDAAMVGAPAAAGAMGIHYAHPTRLGITQMSPLVSGNDGVVDAAKPEIMIYEPQLDGGMKLVAVEYLVFEAAWKAAGHTDPPTLFGEEFVYMKDVPGTPQHEAHGFEPHYELHVWLYRQNPAGTFAEFNPSVSCGALSH